MLNQYKEDTEFEGNDYMNLKQESTEGGGPVLGKKLTKKWKTTAVKK